MKTVYLNEYNIRMERAAYLPFSTGMLRAYAETKPEIKSNYAFAPFFYHIDAPANILAQYSVSGREPDVAAFSCWMWNEQLCLTIAREVKKRWPRCLIIFGGLQVPQKAIPYLQRHPFIDVAARADGEGPFTDTLKRNIETRVFEGIDNITWRAPGGAIVENKTLKHGSRDIDEFESPYLSGLFENIMDDGRFQMQATVETVRGCPFPCSFCAWGNDGLFRKFRYHSVERFKAEIEWAAQHKVRYVFNADSNFGMHQRDEELAQILVDTKTRYGYPEKFRTCFGKNADKRIGGIAKKLHDAGMEKGITLALQSNTPKVLKAINRQNISMAAYQSLQVQFNEAGVPVYSELILGLAEETVESWQAGIEALLRSGLQNQLFVYLNQVLPNTEQSDPGYQERYGLKPHRIELNEIHGALRTEALATEYEDIVVQTHAMPVADWRRMVVFSWLTMTLHSLKLGFYVLLWLQHRHGRRLTEFIGAVAECKGGLIGAQVAAFYRRADELLAGKGRGRAVPGYAPIYWDEEEAAFLHFAENRDAFYFELADVVAAFLGGSGNELIEVIDYQRLRIPAFGDPPERVRCFEFNLPEYFERLLTSQPVALESRPQVMTVHARAFADKAEYAQQTILWGRKSGTMLTRAEYRNG